MITFYKKLQKYFEEVKSLSAKMSDFKKLGKNLDISFPLV